MEKVVEKIIQEGLGEKPQEIERVKVGLVNYVFKVTLSDKSVFARLSEDNPSLKGTEINATLFEKVGINVPRVLASDYTKKKIPYYWQILSEIKGDDIQTVFFDLTEDELTNIANDVAVIFETLSTLPTKKFGYTNAEKDAPFDTWKERMLDKTKMAEKWGRDSGIIDKDFEPRVSEVYETIDKSSAYFDLVKPRLYFSDINKKNLMIYRGRVEGLVDIDTFVSGDPLDALGKIKQSWYGTSQGELYTEAVFQAMNLDEEEKRVATIYAYLFKFFSICSKGIDMRSNEVSQVNWDKVNEYKKHLAALYNEINKAKPLKEAITLNSNSIL